MAKARAIVKRRKAVRNIRKITKTMQMIATAMYQKSLKRAIGTRPFSRKVLELTNELVGSLGDVEHPLLRRPTPENQSGVDVIVAITSNRGLAGAYNGNVLRRSMHLIRDLESKGRKIELQVVGKKGISFFTFQKRPLALRSEAKDVPTFAELQSKIDPLIKRFVDGEIDSVYVVYVRFVSAGVQRTEVATVLPLGSLQQPAMTGAATAKQPATPAKPTAGLHTETIYDFSPSAKELLDDLLPLTVKITFFQTFLDAVTSEHVGRMVAMKSATDNADKINKALTMQYNRARQSQITTELSEIMGGVEAMKG